MPLLDFSCKLCGEVVTDVYKKYNSPRTYECPTCGSDMEPTVGPVAVVFKGKGWAKDGYTPQ